MKGVTMQAGFKVLDAQTTSSVTAPCCLHTSFSWIGSTPCYQFSSAGTPCPGTSNILWSPRKSRLYLHSNLILLRHFLSWGSLLCDDFSLCQVDMKLSRAEDIILMLECKGSWFPCSLMQLCCCDWDQWGFGKFSDLKEAWKMFSSKERERERVLSY